MAEHDEKTEKLGLKVQLLAGDFQKMARLQEQVAVWDVVLTAMRVTASRSTKAFEAITQDQASHQLHLDALHAAGRRREDVLRDFLMRVCTDYSALMCAHATSYRNGLNAVKADAQLKGKYVGGYRICVDEDIYLLRIDEATGDKERGDCSSPQNDGDDDII